MFVKKSSCVFLHASFIPASFLLASVIIASVCIQYIYVCNTVGIMIRMFANGSGDWLSIPGHVIPKTQKNGT